MLQRDRGILSLVVKRFQCLSICLHRIKSFLPPRKQNMFEARLLQAKIFKQLIEAFKDLVQQANIDCNDEEMSIQAMDSSHVSLVQVSLRESGFDHYRCDRPLSLGFNSANLSKFLKCAGPEDVLTLKAEDSGSILTMMFESPAQDRISDFGKNIKSRVVEWFSTSSEFLILS